MVSEEKSFEIMDGRRSLPISSSEALGSGELNTETVMNVNLQKCITYAIGKIGIVIPVFMQCLE